MSKNVKINGTTYSGVPSVAIPLADNSGEVIFREASEVIDTPTATKTITANGTNIDVTNYAKVTVNVPTTGATPTLSSIDATYANTTPVATGTTLDDLTGITVTAKYSLTGYTGDLSKTVTGFTLSGTLTAGQANTVTVSYTEGDVTKTDTITVTVASDTVSVTGVTLNSNSGTLTAGNTFQLSATVAPSNATNKSVTWSSSAPTVAKVENGLVTALTAGSANITVTTVDGSFTATYSVTVGADTTEVLTSSGGGYGIEAQETDNYIARYTNKLGVEQDTALTSEPNKITVLYTWATAPNNILVLGKLVLAKNDSGWYVTACRPYNQLSNHYEDTIPTSSTVAVTVENNKVTKIVVSAIDDFATVRQSFASDGNTSDTIPSDGVPEKRYTVTVEHV